MKLPNGYGSISKLSGKRRRPYIVRVTTGWQINEEKQTAKQVLKVIGYTKTKSEAIKLLSDYNHNPYNLNDDSITFADIFELWKADKFQSISQRTISSYITTYKSCKCLHTKVFKKLRLLDFEHFLEKSDKNLPNILKIKTLINQLYRYAMKHEIVEKDYSKYLDISKYKNKTPVKYKRDKLTNEELDILWKNSNNSEVQIILILTYTGLRISELLDLKKNDVNLKEQYLHVRKSKTSNGIRKVPIANKILPFVINKMNSNSEYLICYELSNKVNYQHYYNKYFIPTVGSLNIVTTPHCLRHTFISMLAAAKISETIIKKIVGHSGAMSLTEKVYTHFDIEVLLEAVNMI